MVPLELDSNLYLGENSTCGREVDPYSEIYSRKSARHP